MRLAFDIDVPSGARYEGGMAAVTVTFVFPSQENTPHTVSGVVQTVNPEGNRWTVPTDVLQCLEPWTWEKK